MADGNGDGGGAPEWDEIDPHWANLPADLLPDLLAMVAEQVAGPVLAQFEGPGSPYPSAAVYMLTAVRDGMGALFCGSAMHDNPLDTLKQAGWQMTNHCKLHPLAGPEFADIQLGVQYVRALHFSALPDDHVGIFDDINDWEMIRAATVAGQEVDFGAYWLQAGAEAWAAANLPDCVFLSIGALVVQGDPTPRLSWSEVEFIIKRKCEEKEMGEERLEEVLRELKEVLFDSEGGLIDSRAAVIIEVDPSRPRGPTSPFEKFVEASVMKMGSLESEYDSVTKPTCVNHGPGSPLVQVLDASIP